MSDDMRCKQLSDVLHVAPTQWEHLLADVQAMRLQNVELRDRPVQLETGDPTVDAPFVRDPSDEPACSRCGDPYAHLYGWTLSRDTLCGTCVRVRWGTHPCLSSHP